MGIKITGTEIINSSDTGDIVFKDSSGVEHFRITRDGQFRKGGKNTDEFESIKTQTTQTLSWNGTNGVLTLSSGNSVDLDGRYATPTDVTNAINAVIDTAPATLNTLNELAAALGDDPNFATTITTALAGKASTSHNHDSVYYNVNQDINITKNTPRLVLDSSNSGSETVEQAATISLGESGTGSASLHLSYIGSGYSYIGMGNLGSDNIADYYAIRLYYTSNNVFFPATNNYITDINAGANAGNTAYGWGNHASAGYLKSVPAQYSTTAENDAKYQPIGNYADAGHTHSYLPLGGGTLTGTLTLNAATPQINFNGTSDGGVDMAIKVDPESLIFFEPEDGDKVHFKIMDDTGVDAPYGYWVNGTQVITSGRALQNVSGNISMFTNNSGYLTWGNFPTPSAPSLVSKATNGDGVQITFNSSSNSEYYEIWSSVGNATDYALVGKVDPSSVASQMTFVDATMSTNSATIYYRVYGINKGIYGNPLEFSHSFSWTSPDIVPSSNVLMDLVIVTWEKPQSRLVKGFTIKKHSTAGTPSYGSATTIASTTNTMFVYTVSRTEVDYNHEFWIEPIY